MNTTINHRRAIMALLVGSTILVALSLMATLLSLNGWGFSDTVMIVLFALTTPWVALGFWNSLIGLFLVHSDPDWLSNIAPYTLTYDASGKITHRTAVVMPVHNEDTEQLFKHLRAITKSLDDTGQAENFDVFVLSDTTNPKIAVKENAEFAAWRSRYAHPQRLHYRRRLDNSEGKAGNVWEFCQSHGDTYEYMVVLDADSVMSGKALLRLVGLMQKNPQIGILQTLAVGLPTTSPFGRIMQFGMRQGMRAYTVGSAWWQGPAGPYWGHNAIVRLAPFKAHCELPHLSGSSPLGGHIMSHDQVEAVLMHRAGYEVWVLPLEDGSFEESPPTLLDYINRDLRWCQGNMQYVRLLGMSGLRLLSRLQLGLAVLMYLAAPAWLGFLLLGFGQVVAAGDEGMALDQASAALGIGIFTGMMGLTLAPKIIGIVDLILRSKTLTAYGGMFRVSINAVVELFVSILMGPIVAVAQTLLLMGLPFGKRIIWNAQTRTAHSLTISQAVRALWPQLLIGLSATMILSHASPASLPWAAPILLGLVLSVPLALVTSSPKLGQLMHRLQICTTPEELSPPSEVSAVTRDYVQPQPKLIELEQPSVGS